MLTFKIFGVRQDDFEYLRSVITQRMTEENLPFAIEEISEVDQFLENGVSSIPSVIVTSETHLQKKDYGDLESFSDAVYDLARKIHHHIFDDQDSLK